MQFDSNVQQVVITSITHHVGMDGFSTDFTVDSGGTYSAVSGWSSNMKANGYNRRMKLADIVHEIAEEVSDTVVAMHDPVSVEDKYDEHNNLKPSITPQRNEFKVIYDGRNWIDLVTGTGGNIPT